MIARDTLKSLSDELDAYLVAQGLPKMSADEVPWETDEQRIWLQTFVRRWENASRWDTPKPARQRIVFPCPSCGCQPVIEHSDVWTEYRVVCDACYDGPGEEDYPGQPVRGSKTIEDALDDWNDCVGESDFVSDKLFDAWLAQGARDRERDERPKRRPQDLYPAADIAIEHAIDDARGGE